MNRPDTKYAKSGKVHVAYQVTGDGPIDMVWAPGTVSHLDLAWESSESARSIERWSSFFRLIRFDKRGTGMSDRPTDAATLEERTDDIRAVMDDAGSKEAVIFGLSEGGSMACLFAATYPNRTRALILWGTQARWIRTEDYPWGQSDKQYEEGLMDLAENGVTISYLTGWGAGVPKDTDPARMDSFLRFFRAGASPSALVALERMNSQIDIRSILPTIRVPTLVMNRTGDPCANVSAAKDLASQIPGARFIEFPGETHQMTDIREQVIAEVEEFVTGVRPQAVHNRVLATILFLDIVNSTKQLSSLGDERWRQLQEKHNLMVRTELNRFQCTEIKTIGDGFLATFDGPTRAVQCARSIRDSASDMGLEIRSGLHTGECDLIDRDVGGIAVNIASRVASTAQPKQVLVSSTVKDLVAGSGLQFEDTGLHSLKGVPGRWRLFKAV